MSEPGSVPPPPPPASPFNPNAVQTPQPAGRGGCGKPVVIGCVSALLLAAIVLLGGIYYVSKNPERVMKMSLSQAQAGLDQKIAADVPQAERERLTAAFTSVYQALDRKQIKLEKMQDLNFKLLEITRKGQLSREDVRQLAEELEALAPGGSANEAEAPPE
ncbi:MAG TPA: hypothetical protein VMW27_04450 [Thermoanaerobaculia bacterium]|nr:hypothetical protein [Thermoanaerobaculia bacterium]